MAPVVVQAQYLWHGALAAPWHVGSSQSGNQTPVSCIVRWFLHYRATREVPFAMFLMSKLCLFENQMVFLNVLRI